MKGLVIAIVVFACSGCSYPVRKILVTNNGGELLDNAYDSLDINRVRAAYDSDSIVVRLKDGRKLVLDPKPVWGILDRDSNLWRYYGGRFIAVRQLDTPSIYSDQHLAGKSSHTDYSFSKTPYSPIYSLNRKNIKREFAKNTCFLSALGQLGFFRSYDSYDRQNGSYRFVRFYKDCLSGNVP